MKHQIAAKAAAALCALGMLTGLPVSAAEEPALIAGKIAYASAAADGAFSDAYFYSDGYFAKSSKVQDPHLTTMSLVLACSACTGSAAPAEALLQEIGYTDIQAESMEGSGRDTLGSVIAHKRTGDANTVAVAVRGGDYGYEWCSNFLVGAEGDAQGFAAASELLCARIRDYIAAHSLENVKLWITGYSRAAAVSDLTGVAVNKDPAAFSTTADDLFVYAFETPRCSADSTVYENIFCIRNANDLVTYVCPEAWGLYTNGVEIAVGTEKTVACKRVNTAMDGSDMIRDAGEMPMSDFLAQFFSFVPQELTRSAYAGSCEKAVADLIALYLGKPRAEWEKAGAYLKEQVLPQLGSDPLIAYIYMYDLKNGILLHNSDLMYRQLADDLLELTGRLSEQAGDAFPVSADELRVLRRCLYPVLRVAGPAFVKDWYHTRSGTDYSQVLPADYADPDYDPLADSTRLSYEDFAFYLSTVLEQKSDAAEESEAPQENALSDYDRGTADGKTAAQRDALADAQQGADAARASYSVKPAPAEDGTSYSAAYLGAYRASYSLWYDRAFKSALKDLDEMPLYHLATFFANLGALTAEHYPTGVFAALQAADSYYAEPVPAETEPVQTETEPVQTETEPIDIETEPFVTETAPTAAKQIAPDSELIAWAEQDYEQRVGVPAKGALALRADGKLTITLTDENGNSDTYVIDAETGAGENAAGEAVDLPQTGSNSPAPALLVLAGLLLTGCGIAAVRRARRKPEYGGASREAL